MHGVHGGIELCHVVSEDVEMKRWSQQPPLASPHFAVTNQETLSCVKETRDECCDSGLSLTSLLRAPRRGGLTEPRAQMAIDELIFHRDACCVEGGCVTDKELLTAK